MRVGASAAIAFLVGILSASVVHAACTGSNGRGWVTSSTFAWQPSRRVDFLLNHTRRARDEPKDGAGVATGAVGFNVPSILFKACLRLDDAHSLTFSLDRSTSAERDVPYGQSTGTATFGNVNRDRQGTVGALAWNWDPAGNDLIDMELRASRSRQRIDVTAIDPGSFAARLWAGLYDLEQDRVTLKNTARFDTGPVRHTLRAGLDWLGAAAGRKLDPNPLGLREATTARPASGG